MGIFSINLHAMNFRHFLLLFLMMVAAGSAMAQEQDTVAWFDPNEVLVPAGDDELMKARRAACEIVAGEWTYSKPYVHATGSTLIGKLGKPIAKSKLKKNLDKAYKKLKLKDRWTLMTLSPDGMWQMKVLGLPVKGSYNYDPESQELTLKWNGIPLKSHTHRDGKKLYVAFDMDRLLMVLSLLSGISHSETLKALALLSNNFSNVMVGFEMKLK